MTRLLKVGAAVFLFGLAVSPGVTDAQSKPSAPTITVYKTPT